MIEYECPECGEPLESPDSLVGKMDTCPVCGSCFVLANRAGRVQFGIALGIAVIAALALAVALLVAVGRRRPAENSGTEQTGAAHREDHKGRP